MKPEEDLLPGGKNSPFHVPDGFFKEFKSDLLESTQGNLDNTVFRMLRYVGKYAAILLILFFAGKGVISTILPGQQDESLYTESGTDIELVFMQVSEQELTDFITEELEEDLQYYTDF